MQDTASTTRDTPGKTERQRILGLIIRSLFIQTWDVKDQDSSPAARKAAFNEARPELRKTAVKMLRFLENKGVEMTLDESVAK